VWARVQSALAGGKQKIARLSLTWRLNPASKPTLEQLISPSGFKQVVSESYQVFVYDLTRPCIQRPKKAPISVRYQALIASVFVRLWAPQDAAASRSNRHNQRRMHQFEQNTRWRAVLKKPLALIIAWHISPIKRRICGLNTFLPCPTNPWLVIGWSRHIRGPTNEEPANYPAGTSGPTRKASSNRFIHFLALLNQMSFSYKTTTS